MLPEADYVTVRIRCKDHAMLTCITFATHGVVGMTRISTSFSTASYSRRSLRKRLCVLPCSCGTRCQRSISDFALNICNTCGKYWSAYTPFSKMFAEFGNNYAELA